jgi:hypothetical protein
MGNERLDRHTGHQSDEEDKLQLHQNAACRLSSCFAVVD